MKIVGETMFKTPFQATAVEVGAVLDPKTNAPSQTGTGHAVIKTVQDLINFATAARGHMLIPIPDLATQAIVLAALWSGQLVNPPGVEEAETSDDVEALEAQEKDADDDGDEKDEDGDEKVLKLP